MGRHLSAFHDGPQRYARLNEALTELQRANGAQRSLTQTTKRAAHFFLASTCVFVITIVGRVFNFSACDHYTILLFTVNTILLFSQVINCFRPRIAPLGLATWSIVYHGVPILWTVFDLNQLFIGSMCRRRLVSSFDARSTSWTHPRLHHPSCRH